ncbi:hypothetical protein Salmuc_00316 [Salipiger mucosus DSM 16094]|uniref:Uncharacterized protein n=1 Tax=Salipiger mucosus DSM 16094 TaxID=1123237 RepID=S9RE74_9RHOB|nr:hypothetical protein Salmuc_00316 [Salipiger mucosus DSM 16094]
MPDGKPIMQNRIDPASVQITDRNSGGRNIVGRQPPSDPAR